MNNANVISRIHSSALSEKGRRANNEDFILYFEPSDPKERQEIGCIYIVADGVGGASIGERASKFAAEKVKYEYIRHPEIEPAARLRQAITRANREIFEYAGEKGIRMATTITVAVIIGNSLIVANVGDSRVYLIRNGEAKQITRDHNIVGELIRGGSMTEAEALKSKAKNRLTRSIGGNEDVHVDFFGPIPLQPDDKILLCSDGLTRYALKEDLENIVKNGSPEQITKDAVDFAVKQGHGGADNISVITVVYEPTNMETVRSARPRPISPVERWEITETDPGFDKRNYTRSKNIVRLIGVSTFIGSLVLLATAWLYFDAPNIIGQPGTDQPTMIVPPSGNQNEMIQTQTPELIQSSINTQTEISDTVTDEESTNLETSTVEGKVENCPTINVRSFPSISSTILGKLKCGDTIILIGQHDGGEDSKLWYQINYSDLEGGQHVVWVIASSVKILPPDTAEKIPFVLPSLPTPTETFTSTLGANIVGEGDCKYYIKSGDSLTKIASNFNIENYKKIYCAPENSDKCDITTNPNNLVPGWIIIIPSVSEELCNQNGGQTQ